MEVIVVRNFTELPKCVLVYDIHGERLENCTVRKARVLRSEKKARVYSVSPYSIQLLNVTGRPPRKESSVES